MKFSQLTNIADSYMSENATADSINNIRTAGITGLAASAAAGAVNIAKGIRALFSKPDAEKLFKILEPYVLPLNKLTPGSTILVSADGVAFKTGKVTQVIKDTNAIRNSPIFRNITLLKNSQLFNTTNLVTFTVQVEGEQPTTVIISISPESKVEAIFDSLIAMVTPAVTDNRWCLSYNNLQSKFQLTKQNVQFRYVNDRVTTTRAVGAKVSSICMYTEQMVSGTIVARIPGMPANMQAINKMVASNVNGLRVLVDSTSTTTRRVSPKPPLVRSV